MAIEIARYSELFADLERYDTPEGAGTLTPREPLETSDQDAVSEWNRMSESEKAKVRANYDRWQAMPPAEQQKQIEGYRRFKSLPPEKQRQIILNYRRARG